MQEPSQQPMQQPAILSSRREQAATGRLMRHRILAVLQLIGLIVYTLWFSQINLSRENEITFGAVLELITRAVFFLGIVLSSPILAIIMSKTPIEQLGNGKWNRLVAATAAASAIATFIMAWNFIDWIKLEVLSSYYKNRTPARVALYVSMTSLGQTCLCMLQMDSCICKDPDIEAESATNHIPVANAPVESAPPYPVAGNAEPTDEEKVKA